MKIKHWDKWQTYRKDRGTPPWIKVHRNLMSNSDWVSLSDAEKGQLVSMWIVAADKNGTLPDCAKMVQKMCMLDNTPDFNKFKKLGFIDVKRPTKKAKRDAPETETETETETELRHIVAFDSKKHFEDIWKRYPNGDGKKSALKSFTSTVKTDENLSAINTALNNYLASEKVRNGFVKNGSTWFNNWEDWVDWVEPQIAVVGKQKEMKDRIMDGFKKKGEGNGILDFAINSEEPSGAENVAIGLLTTS